jgi:hypothetical protein
MYQTDRPADTCTPWDHPYVYTKVEWVGPYSTQEDCDAYCDPNNFACESYCEVGCDAWCDWVCDVCDGCEMCDEMCDMCDGCEMCDMMCEMCDMMCDMCDGGCDWEE